MSFLHLEGKTILVAGAANRKSVAFHIGQLLTAEGVEVVYSVHNEERKTGLSKLLPDAEIHVCDVGSDDQIAALRQAVGQKHDTLHGMVHSIAFANYASYSGKFHEVQRRDFLGAVDISCYSLIGLAGAFADLLDSAASVVAISISTTQMAAESYGYMAPAKAALDSTVTFLAKSFARDSGVRFNAVCAGLLKTRASAGIPNYLENFLYAEQATLRKKALSCDEVAGVAAFLLSPRSSGINAQGIVVDAGMGRNYFDSAIVKPVTEAAWPTNPAQG